MRIASQIPNSDQSPLYDVRNPARAPCEGCNVRSDVSRTIFSVDSRPVFALSSYDAAAFATIRPAEPKLAQPAKAGGARRDRTDDLMLAKHALSQLSYGPVPEDECFMLRSPSLALRRSSLRSRRPAEPEAAEQRRLVGLGRLELPTSRLSSARSNQLSYKPLTTRSVARAHRLAPDASHKRKPLARVRPRR